MSPSIFVSALELALLFASPAAAYPYFPREESPLANLLFPRQVEVPPPDTNYWIKEPYSAPHWDNKTWTLCTDKLVQNHWQSTPYVANGYIGQRLAAEGQGWYMDVNETDPDSEIQPINGWPLDNRRSTFGTVAGFWNSQPNTSRTNFQEIANTGGESVISGLPHWATLLFKTESGDIYKPGIDNSTLSNFKQCLSLRDGIVHTSVDWKPKGGEITYKLKYTVMANRQRASIGYMQLDITPDADTTGSVADVLDGQGALRTWFNTKGEDAGQNIIWSSVHPQGLEDVTAWVYSHVRFSDASNTGTRGKAEDFQISANESTNAQSFSGINLKKGQKYSVYKYVSITSTDAFPDNAEEQAKNELLAAVQCGPSTLEAEHKAAWGQIWEQGSIETPNDDELQIGIQSTVFHLLSSLRSSKEGKGKNDNSIAVGGLSSESYAGFIFWDADLWMFPGIAAMWPEYAKVIINYRFRQLDQAVENSKERNYTEAATYSWTSGRFGNCTGTGPCFDYQYHLNTDIAMTVYDYFANTGDTEFLKSEGWPLVWNITNFFTQYVEYVNGSYHTFNMTDPDEYANHINDGAFTNVGIKKLMGWAQYLAPIVGAEIDPKWKDIEEKIYIPYDSEVGIISEFTGMNGTVEIKQVDVVLTSYPLGFQLNQSQAENDLYFYAKTQSPDGPAMTWGIYSIVSSQLINQGCQSWTHATQSSQSYLRAPWYQFSEQVNDNITENGNTNPAFPFLTGHGGYLQVWTHGYSGFRSDPEAFYLDPSLPPHMDGGIQFHTLKWRGASFNVDIDQNGTRITRVPSQDSSLEYSGPAPVRIPERNGKGGLYHLSIGQYVDVNTRLPHKNPPLPAGNLASCTPVTSNVSHAPGQFPMAAVDGSNATTWQPASVNPAAITLDLADTFPPAPGEIDIPGDERTINGILIVWGNKPAVSWVLEMSNTSSYDIVSEVTDETVGNWERVWAQEQVAISQEWDIERYTKPVLEAGNITTVQFDRGYTGRFARLTIAGSQGEIVNGYGATVAELALLGNMMEYS